MKSLAVLTAASAAGLLVLASAAPASAAGNAIDPGDSLYALNCDNVYNDWQLFGVDSTTAFSTPIGDGDGYDADLDSCAGQAAYNPATGKSYYLQWFDDVDDLGYDEALASVDVVTGESTQIGGFYYNNGEFPEYIDVDSIAIGGDGAAYALADGSLWELNLETAFVTPVGETEPDMYSFAWDSKTGGFYGITYLNEVYQIDVTDGSTVDLGEIVFPEDGYTWRVYSLQFDKAGTLWVEVDQSGNSIFQATLWSLTFDTFTAPVYSGVFTDDPFYTESLLIIPGAPAPALAATGSEVAPIAAGALALLTLGGAVLLVRRRRAA